jgi:hypothetical protein
MHEGLTPDLSLGTHFFNDIVEMDVVYMGISPNKAGSIFNETFLKRQTNKLSELFPESSSYADTIHVIDAEDIHPTHDILLHADTLEQVGAVFLTKRKNEKRHNKYPHNAKRRPVRNAHVPKH